MKSRTSCITTMTLLTVLACAAPLAAQGSQDRKDQHHHYKVIDIGTFGGPSSYFNSLSLTDRFRFGTVFYGFAHVRNQRGILVGLADTSTPDPYPAFCYTPDCFVSHAFQWRRGIKTDLARFLAAPAARPSGSIRKG